MEPQEGPGWFDRMEAVVGLLLERGVITEDEAEDLWSEDVDEVEAWFHKELEEPVHW